MKVYIEYNEYCTNSERSNEEFGSWYEQLEYQVERASTNLDNSCCLYEEYELPVTPLSKVYVVVIRYSTGDSFGSSSGNGGIIWAYSDRKLAEATLREFENNIDEYSVEVLVEGASGIEMRKLSNPASGYFESLESLYIKELVVDYENYRASA